MKVPLGQLLLAVGGLIWVTGCASIGPPEPPSLELPKPPSDLRAMRKGDKVTLSWTVPARTTDRQSVRYLGETRICRGLDPALSECGAPVGEVAPEKLATADKSPGQKVAATYTDVLSAELAPRDPAAELTYAVEVLNASGRGAGLSNRVRVPAVPTLPPPELTAELSGEGVILRWTGIPPDPEGARLWHAYRVYRRQESRQERSTRAVLVEEVKIGTTEIVDRNIEWEKTYYYHATIVSRVGMGLHPCSSQPSDSGTVGFTDCVGAVQIEGDDSPEVKIFAHDIFPPAVPSGLQAVFSGPGQPPFIDLIWAPVTDADLDGYNIYRREDRGAPVKVNQGPVKTPAFRDTQVAAGKTYFYSVSAVDLRGNESGRSEEASESVP